MKLKVRTAAEWVNKTLEARCGFCGIKCWSYPNFFENFATKIRVSAKLSFIIIRKFLGPLFTFCHPLRYHFVSEREKFVKYLNTLAPFKAQVSISTSSNEKKIRWRNQNSNLHKAERILGEGLWEVNSMFK